MRIDLVTPFAEKDAAKALGARWDSAKKTWYITDMTDPTPFQRWIPNRNAAIANSADGSWRPAPMHSRIPTAGTNVIVTRSPIEVPHCGCDVLPWEHCVHTAGP